jgi:hypothetical protein
MGWGWMIESRKWYEEGFMDMDIGLSWGYHHTMNRLNTPPIQIMFVY